MHIWVDREDSDAVYAAGNVSQLRRRRRRKQSGGYEKQDHDDEGWNESVNYSFKHERHLDIHIGRSHQPFYLKFGLWRT